MDFVDMELWYTADNAVGVIQANAIWANNNSGTNSPVSGCHQQVVSRHCNKGAVTFVLPAENCM
eukprot:9526079-Ditylum_brightwellii.AAC.1